MTLRLIDPPYDTPVTLAEAKAHLRVIDSNEDAIITAMIHSATAVAEQETGRALMEQTWQLTLDSFDSIELTRTPVISAIVNYVGTAGVTQTLSPSLYRFRQDDFGFAKIELAYGATWPALLDDADVVTVTYDAGYEDGVPQGIKSWILLTVAALYENREAEAYSARAVSTTVKMSFVDGLLDRYRVRG